MERADRLRLIQAIEDTRGSQLIVYITGDRRGLETKIASDVFPMFHTHLAGASTRMRQSGGPRKIDLFLYSTGGTTIAGYALVNLFREYCDELSVIVPFKALSCATLVALGADEVLMTQMGQLSPIDPSITHPLGPQAATPGGAPGLVPVSVEDVNAFVELARNEVGLSDELAMTKVLELLAGAVNPLVLGAVQRSRAQIAFLASELMRRHSKEEDRISETVEILTRGRFSHAYIFTRREAKQVLKLPIVEPDDELTALIVSLLDAYNDIIKMDTPYNPEAILGQAKRKSAQFHRGIIESRGLTHVFRTSKELRRIAVPAQQGRPEVTGIEERIVDEAWMDDDDI